RRRALVPGVRGVEGVGRPAAAAHQGVRALLRRRRPDLGRPGGLSERFGPARMYSHSRYTRMLDGRSCVLQWTQSIGGPQNIDLHFVVSDRSGREWSVPQPTGIQAQTSWVADLG